MSHSSRVADHVVLKLLKVLAKTPQCKSLGNARNVSWPNPRTHPENSGFQPKVTVLHLCSAHAGHTPSGPRVHLGLGRGLSLRLTRRYFYKSHRRAADRCARDTGSNTGGASRTWVLTARRSLPLAAAWGAGHTAGNMVCTYTVRGAAIHSTRRSLPGGGVGITQTTRETVTLQKLWHRGRPWWRLHGLLVFDWQHEHLVFCPDLRLRFPLSPRSLVSHTAFILAFEPPGLI